MRVVHERMWGGRLFQVEFCSGFINCNFSYYSTLMWNEYSSLVGNCTYTHTIRRPEINEESPEVRTQIGVREYEASNDSTLALMLL